METKISVFTASYNYGHLLDRVYEGLKAQTKQNFEWIIVDDCSTDNTEELVASWLADSPSFSIRYHKQEVNQGKMAAMNLGVSMASYPLFLLIDADDALMPHALETFTNEWNSIEDSVKPRIGALVGLCEDQHGMPVGTDFPTDPLICNYYDFKFKYGITGDKCEMFRTEALKEFPFYDKIDRHVIHSATYFDMAEKYDFYCFNTIVRVYYRHEEGKVSLSVRTKKLRFLKGRQFYAEARINKYFDRISSKKFKFLTYLSYIRYSRHIGLTPVQMLKRITKLRRRFICLIMLPLGYSLILQDLLRKRV